MSLQIHTPNLMSIARQQRKVRKTKFKKRKYVVCGKPSERTFMQRAVTQVKVGQPRQKSNLICIMSRHCSIPNFKSISQRMTEKNRKNEWTDIFAKGYDSSKSRSTEIKFKLDLYHVNTKTYMYTKFQVNISKDD